MLIIWSVSLEPFLKLLLQAPVLHHDVDIPKTSNCLASETFVWDSWNAYFSCFVCPHHVFLSSYLEFCAHRHGSVTDLSFSPRWAPVERFQVMFHQATAMHYYHLNARPQQQALPEALQLHWPWTLYFCLLLMHFALSANYCLRNQLWRVLFSLYVIIFGTWAVASKFPALLLISGRDCSFSQRRQAEDSC